MKYIIIVHNLNIISEESNDLEVVSNFILCKFPYVVFTISDIIMNQYVNQATMHCYLLWLNDLEIISNLTDLSEISDIFRVTANKIFKHNLC